MQQMEDRAKPSATAAGRYADLESASVPLGHRRGLVALALLLATLALCGALGTNAAAQAPSTQLQSSIVTEGETAVLRIVNTPAATEHFLRLKPFQAPYTASPSDVELRGSNGAVISPGAPARVTRQSDGAIEFSVVAHSDKVSDAGEIFGVQLCSAEAYCSGDALLGEWTIEIVEPSTGPGVDEGLIPDTELDGPPLGEPTGPVSVIDYLGPDGIYRMRDGDGELQLRLLSAIGIGESQSSSAASLEGLLIPDAATSTERVSQSSIAARLEGLAADGNAAAAHGYASPPSGAVANGSGSTTPAAPGEWLVAPNGQLFLLVGGVNVYFASHLDESEITAVLVRHQIAGARIEPLGELPNAYLIRTVSDVESLRLADALADEPGVDSAVPNLYTPRTLGPTAQPSSYSIHTLGARIRCRQHLMYPDKLSGCLWHLNADTDYRYFGQDPTIDINLGNVWDTTMGEGVTVAVIDRTWEATHPDLADNIDNTRSKHWGGLTGEDPTKEAPYHGTAVAGIVAARDNGVGGRGVAPRATLVNYNLLDNLSSANEVAAMTLHKGTIAVYNMSYGAWDRAGISNSGGDGWRRALEEGLSHGFGGKGSSYVKAAGNGEGILGADWATLDQENNHRGVIAVCSVNARGVSARYSENGPSLWVCAPSRDYGLPGILTTIGTGDYFAEFSGSSASAPIVSGVVALMRSANSDLTWRDVKIILANTAQKNDAGDNSWQSGAKKYGSTTEPYSFSNEYGFGTVDASAAVQAAREWVLLPAERSAEVASSTAVPMPTQGEEIELTADVTTDIDFVEQVTITVEADISDMRDYRWSLVSPSGTESLLSPQFFGCIGIECKWNGTFRFGSNRHLGEEASGAWKIKVRHFPPFHNFCSENNSRSVASAFCRGLGSFDEEIKSWTMVVYGHKTEAGQPVRLTATPQNVTEGNEVSVNVRVEGAAPTADLVVPLKLTDGDTTPPGAAGADYAALASITIPAGSTSATAKLATNGDAVDEPDETFTIGLGALPSGFKPAGGSATVTITDDDPLPTVRLKTSSASVTEGESVSITASLSNPSAEAVTLDVSIAPVAPTVAADGSISAATTLTIAAGALDSTGTVTFTAAQNELYELSTATAKKFTVSATAGGGRNVAHPDAITVEIEDDESKPAVSITAGAGGTEGSDAAFTLTATPKPADDLDVNVAVSASGDYGVSAGTQTVTIPSSGTATLTLATSGDDVDEPDGSVTVTVQSGTDYTPASTASASVDVADDDLAEPDYSDYQTVVDLLIEARDNPENARVRNNPAHIRKLNRVLAAIGYDSGEQPMPASQIHGNAAKWPHSPFKAASDYLNSQQAQQKPEVTVTGAGDITEGGTATFTITANPGPAADLTVSVTAATTGDFGYGPLPASVTIPASGSATVTVTTTDDQTDEPDGSVTLTINAGSGYTVGAQSSETAAVADDDVPEVSITAAGDITEGGTATFTITAGPAPAAALPVSVTVTQNGDHGAGPGPRTVTVPTTGSATLTVATTDDTNDEPDGSVTVTINSGGGYTVSATQGAATVAVTDDDDPPVDQDQPDRQEPVACTGDPTLTVNSPEASRNDQTVDFEVSLDCIPSGRAMILLTPVRDGEIGQNIFVSLSAEETTATVTVTIGNEEQLGLALVWSSGLANRAAQGDVTYTD